MFKSFKSDPLKTLCFHRSFPDILLFLLLYYALVDFEIVNTLLSMLTISLTLTVTIFT